MVLFQSSREFSSSDASAINRVLPEGLTIELLSEVNVLEAVTSMGPNHL